MSSIRHRVERLELSLRQPIAIEERQRQIRVALAHGTEPTDERARKLVALVRLFRDRAADVHTLADSSDVK